MKLDITVFNFFHALTGRLGVFDIFFIFLAKYLIYFLIAVFLIFIFRFKSGARQKIFIFCFSALTVLLARGIIFSIIRLAYLRERPFIALQFKPLFEAADASFPSGHTTLLLAMAFAAFLFSRKFGIWFSILALLVGLSRVVAGVHYPSDILGGLLTALVSVVFLWVCLRGSWKKLNSD